jgi:hypothetical protein
MFRLNGVKLKCPMPRKVVWRYLLLWRLSHVLHCAKHCAPRNLLGRHLGEKTVAKFLIPDWGDIVNSGLRLSLYRPASPDYIGWRASRKILSQSRLYPPFQVLRIWPQKTFEQLLNICLVRIRIASGLLLSYPDPIFIRRTSTIKYMPFQFKMAQLFP